MSRAPAKKPKIAKAQGRSVQEWIGKNPDSKIPDAVRLRVFDRFHGKCYLSDKKIMPGDLWDVEHIKPLEEGGEHRESNFAPALKAPHKIKTAEEGARRSKADAVKKKHLGLKSAPAAPIQSAPMVTTPRALERRQRPSKTCVDNGGGIFGRIKNT